MLALHKVCKVRSIRYRHLMMSQHHIHSFLAVKFKMALHFATNVLTPIQDTSASFALLPIRYRIKQILIVFIFMLSDGALQVIFGRIDDLTAVTLPPFKFDLRFFNIRHGSKMERFTLQKCKKLQKKLFLQRPIALQNKYTKRASYS